MPSPAGFMDIRQLLHFVAATEHGSLVRAARAINISQPALSRSIMSLEASLGVPLLERRSRGVVPTVFGESLLTHARAILAARERAQHEINLLSGLDRGTVKIGITANFTRHIVASAIGKFLQRHAEVDITVVSALYNEQVARLRRGDIDMFFGLLPPALAETDLNVEELALSHSRVFARADHPLCRRPTVSLADLAAHGWIVLSHEPAMQLTFHRVFEANGVPWPRRVLTTNSISFLLSALRETKLLSIVPEHLVADDVARRRILPVHNDQFVVSSAVGFLTRRKAARSPAVSALMGSIRAEYTGSTTAAPRIQPAGARGGRASRSAGPPFRRQSPRRLR
jgi:DNA-binding transcriptional LysR family regulator